ncbi:hypothetical protein [Herpetosiphon giganteus]|uniref:hypothetical protein n=1 Tax=Herpetosiphon giganteus TaxID=2029754 RepID=UPI001958114D|nr:hypothetical protein [Herpetosiphon giganteus]MBM7846645.1 hypothetical protein [Herpetosiphon giganteus]
MNCLRAEEKAPDERERMAASGGSGRRPCSDDWRRCVRACDWLCEESISFYSGVV